MKVNKANILLVNASEREAYGKLKPPLQMHMGLAYIASMVRGHNVTILDMARHKHNLNNFIDTVKRGKFDVAGFSVTTPTFMSSLKLAKLLKSYSPDTTVVFGGIHSMMHPEESLLSDCVDLVVAGEGEITFREIIRCVKEKRAFSGVEGIFYKENAVIKKTNPRPLIDDLDTLPFPERESFKNRQYTYPDSLHRHTAPIITSRGCPGACTFCVSHNIFSRRFRARSAKNIVDEIEVLVKKYKTKEIHIWDDNFATDKKRVFNIRDEILKRNIKVKFAFPNGIRADFLNKEIIKALKDMGTYSLAIGVESGSQSVLNRTGKGIKLEKIREIFALAKKMRLETWAFFMIGLLGDNPGTVKRTIAFAKRLDPDIAKFHILKPFPGSKLYDYLSSKRFILTEDYNQFGFHTPPIHRLEKLSPEDILEWQKRAYASFYFRPGKILQQLARIKTLHRFLVNLQAGAGLVKMIRSKNE